ncbi:hypothetical protein B0H14DRAFT_3869700 [Mycena olivaceomarginata]|nr:hypothetical protein B0H14DRAFT_3869700 [Mycena olivaceomarginata]
MSAQIYSLPQELLVAIVTAEQEDRRARAVGLEPTRTVFNSEWALSHTSRRFRDAIVGAPALWTLIEIDLDLPVFPGCVEILKLYLQRSNRCHLSVTLRSYSPEDHGFTKGLSEILPHVERLWKFAIILYTRSVAKVLAPLRDVGAPHLQNLEIVNLNGIGDRIGAGLFASGAPRLSFLRIDGLKFQLPAPSWTVALTHLELRESQRADDNSVLVAITAQCPSLVYLHVDLSWLRAEASHWPFRISTLKSLNISVPADEYTFPLWAIIDLFETPALAEFIIEGAHGDQIVDLFSSSSLPHVSFPALTTLSFIHISPCTCDVDLSLDMQMYYPPSAVFPALSSLTLINQCFTSHFVKDILGQPWPQLQTLALCPPPIESEFADASVAVGKALRDTVRPDHNRRQRLPKLRLSPALLALEDWQDAGADVEVFDGVAVAESFQRLYSY